MVLNFDNVKSIDIVIVGYTFKRKEKVYKFNSLLQRFYDANEASWFEYELMEKLPKIDPKLNYEVYYVSSNIPIEPTEDIKVKGKRYCPYCGQINKLIDNKGYEICPICHCSSNDYEFRNYNDLWNKSNKKRTRKKAN